MNTQFQTTPPAEETMHRRITAAHSKIARWWRCENSDPVLDIRLKRPDFPASRANTFWPSAGEEPDLANVVSEQIRDVHSFAYAADAIPHLMGNYGSRGTPMILSFFLGARPNFDEDTVWYSPIIDDITSFDPVLDPENIWLRRSLDLFAEQLRATPMGVVPCIPGIGDYLTNLAGLRGMQELMFDMIDEPGEIHRLREKLVPIFAEVFGMFYSRYPSRELGAATWMTWAPGSTYPVQCDFSTMMNPSQFREFVLPELEFLHEHIEFMCWHLDGPDELKHLDALLGDSHIKAIQWLPGAGQPPESDPQWRPVIEKILDAGKAVHLAAYDLEQARELFENYHRPGVFIRCWDGFNGENARKIGSYFGETLW